MSPSKAVKVSQEREEDWEHLLCEEDRCNHPAKEHGKRMCPHLMRLNFQEAEEAVKEIMKLRKEKDRLRESLEDALSAARRNLEWKEPYTDFTARLHFGDAVEDLKDDLAQGPEK